MPPKNNDACIEHNKERIDEARADIKALAEKVNLNENEIIRLRAFQEKSARDQKTIGFVIMLVTFGMLLFDKFVLIGSAP